MAREMGVIELHHRAQVTTDVVPGLDDIDPAVPVSLFNPKRHGVSLVGADDIMGKASCPAFDPQSAKFQYRCSEFLGLMDAKTDLETGSKKDSLH